MVLRVVLTYHSVPTPKHAHWIATHMASLLNCTMHYVDKTDNTYTFGMHTNDESMTFAQILELLGNLAGEQPVPDGIRILPGYYDEDNEVDTDDDDDEVDEE